MRFGRRIAAVILTVLMLLAAGAGAESEYRLHPGNVELFENLVSVLKGSIRKPEGTEEAAEALVEQIRENSESDGRIAGQMTEEWFRNYLDGDYPLRKYNSKKETAEELEDTDLDRETPRAFIVLGYRLKDGEMTRELKGRCKAAAAAARSFPESVLICTGGVTGSNNPSRHSEAGMMKKYLIRSCGVDEARIRTDPDALSTLANAWNSFRILQSEGEIHEVTLVTSTYHMKWAREIFRTIAAVFREETGYGIDIDENYCYATAPTVTVDVNYQVINQLRALIRDLTLEAE